MRRPPLDLRELWIVREIAAHGSIHGAARALGYKQSSLSRTLHLLEGRVGAALFMRSPGGATLTLAGEAFLRKANDLLDGALSLYEQTRRWGNGERGLVTVGIESCIPPGRASVLLEPCRIHQPDISFRYREGTREFLSHLVEMDFLDLAITTLPPMDTVLAMTPLWSDRVVVVVPAGHPLADRQSVLWTTFARETFLIGTDNAGHELHTLLKRRMTQAGLHPLVRHHDIGSLRVIAVVANGEGIALLPEAWIGFLPDGMKERIVAIEVLDGEGRPHLDYGAISKKGGGSPATLRILTALKAAQQSV
ncbi:LysR family transcriptional regulator [Acetobacter estunensis]|uniref:LysR family transcriptional regulator n=1 Tax=Acetobacter estunensis TaxID=104097 RepID=UPI001C2D6C12|nr:LysR family transcriptional regulator [Acetobacter estunensis]